MTTDVVPLVNKILALGTILADVFIALTVLFFVFDKKDNLGFFKFLCKRGLLLAFIVSILSTLGSLFYSQIAGFAPCDLCWLQRIFMYPQILLLGWVLWKKDNRIFTYSLVLSGLGLIVALYHNFVYYYNGGVNKLCSLANGVSCAKRYVLEFGYITIPSMALTAFALIILFLTFYKLRHKFLQEGEA